MYSVSDLQKLVQMLDYLGFAGNIAPPHSVVIGGGWVTPGASGTLFASNGASADPSFETLGTLGIQPALGYTPAHSGANSDITSLSGLSTPLSILQGGTGAITAALARAALGAAASGANTDITSLASPAIGSATATTQARGTNNTVVATTAYVLRQAAFLNILDYGGNNGGSVDNSTALTAAIAAAPAGKVIVYFPPGIYAFSAAYSYTIPTGGSVTLLGAGPDATYLYWAANGGLTLNHTGSFASAHVRDMTFLAGTTGGGAAIALNQTVSPLANPANTAPSDISNVSFRGIDGYTQTFYWNTAIAVNSVSTVNFTNVFATGSVSSNGNGVVLGSTASANGTQYNFQGCTFNYLAVGILYGNYIQGVAVNQCNFTGGTNGIVCPTGTVATSELIVTNSQFNNSATAFLFQTSIPATAIIGNYIIQQVAGAIGISSFQPGLYQIVGNTFNGTLASSQIGISFSSGSAGGVITGNTFYHLPTAIFLPAGTGGVNVQSNAYVLNTVDINNAGANTIGGSSP